MMAGLLELSRRDRAKEHNWNTNPITAKCIHVYKDKLQGYNAKRTIQGALMLQMLRIRRADVWEVTARRLLFLLHKYKARDFALLLKIFNQVKDFELFDEEDVISAAILKKEEIRQISAAIPSNFFERVVAMLPMHVPYMTNRDLITTLEVLVKRNLGGQRLFDHYIYLKIERNVLKFTCDEYCRTVRILADKGFSQDSVFWDDFMFKYTTHDINGKEGKRTFTFN